MLCLLVLLAASDRIHIVLDTSEAGAVLAIVRTGEGWDRLFASEPYRRLKQRENAIAERFHEPSIVLTDEKFRAFVTSKELASAAPALSATLQRWKRADLAAIAARILPYLPASATVRAKIYPVIKEGINSFVWDAATDPAIFLYVDPKVSREKFENTAAHELHHIGLTSALAEYEKRIAALPPPAHAAAENVSAFGEGLAMLAAAGGPDADPMPASREQWTRDLANFDANLRTVNVFFEDVLSGRLATPEAIEERAGSFFGRQQGLWYTVGYRMAVIVEKKFGRAALIATMLDPRLLLVRYNQAAPEGAARWSAAVLDGVRAPNPK